MKVYDATVKCELYNFGSSIWIKEEIFRLYYHRLDPRHCNRRTLFASAPRRTLFAQSRPTGLQSRPAPYLGPWIHRQHYLSALPLISGVGGKKVRPRRLGARSERRLAHPSVIIARRGGHAVIGELTDESAVPLSSRW